MPLTIVQISVRLRNILAELDRYSLHLPAIHIARAIEIIETEEDKPDFQEQKSEAAITNDSPLTLN